MNCNPCCGCFPPITTYNPSVADNFPTILQQVEYLKALLKKYPSQQWFITQEKVTEETVKLDSTKIPLRGRGIETGDFILGNTVNGTILIFQYTGVMIETTYYAVQYVGIYSSQILAEQAEANAQEALERANGANELAGQALSLAQTNEKDIGTLDGQVAEITTVFEVTSVNTSIDEATYNKLKNNSAIKIKYSTNIFTQCYITEYGNLFYFSGSHVFTDGKLKAIRGLVVKKLSETNYQIAIANDVDFYENGDLLRFSDSKGNQFMAFSSLSGQIYFQIDGSVSGMNFLKFPAVGGIIATSKNLKTIFGNQSLVGTGNIDLYKHHINLIGTNETYDFKSGEIYIDVISSNNLNVDSLTDLKTLLGNTFKIQAYGSSLGVLPNNALHALYMDESNLTIFDEITNVAKNASLSFITFTDTVTTI